MNGVQQYIFCNGMRCATFFRPRLGSFRRKQTIDRLHTHCPRPTSEVISLRLHTPPTESSASAPYWDLTANRLDLLSMCTHVTAHRTASAIRLAIPSLTTPITYLPTYYTTATYLDPSMPSFQRSIARVIGMTASTSASRSCINSLTQSCVMFISP